MRRLRGMTGRAVLVVLLLGAILAIYALIRQLAEAGPGALANQFVLPLLSITLIVLLLGMAGVLIRNLVRLIMDRKRGILGSRLRTKLVFFFMALVLPPAVILFYGSAVIIKMTVEGILRTPIESVTDNAKLIVDEWADQLQAQSLRHAERIARDVERARPGDRARIGAIVRRWRDREDLDLVVVTSGAEPVASGLEDPTIGHGALAGLARDDIDEVLATGTPRTGLGYAENGLLAHAIVPVRARAPGSGARGVVAAGVYLPPDVAHRLESIALAADQYRQFRVQRRELVALYLSVIALIFLVTIFVATWMGFYLSRRITVPVQDVASATREIASGNLGVRVRSKVGDELGTLVDAFNHMAAQLQESQSVITRSTAELRRSNRALEERRRYIETLLANLSPGVLSMDSRGEVTTVNPAVERILGVRIEPGAHARSALRVPGLERLRDLVAEAEREDRDGFRTDLTLHPRGESIAVAVHASPLRARTGERLGTLIVVEDLTDLLRAQRAAAWQEAARRIAHEIKNPLTPIQLAAQRLRKKYAEDAADFGAVLPNATASIEREVGALKRLVDEFSRFARMPEVKPEPVEFGDVVESVMSLYRGLSEIRWEVDTDPGLTTVVVDAEQMRRALINLIDNAVDAVEGCGTVRVATRAHAGPGSLRIEVADSGPGIPTPARDKLFTPHASRKTRGTGLGLAIVHRVVSEHGGTIRVEDCEPHGARFVIEIPAPEPAPVPTRLENRN